MTKNLVVTAMGADRPGIVSQIARLASDCDCDIVDSRVALFGNEFTFAFMLSGSWAAIAKIESTLPALSAELELLTIMKRTSTHTPTHFASRIEATFSGQDQRGTMKAITEFLAEKSLDLASMKSHAETANGEPTQQIQLSINVPNNLPLDTLESDITAFAHSLSLDCKFKLLTDNSE
ncbi:MAG: glycine cleavage system protein R [Parashewanella sp.]